MKCYINNTRQDIKIKYTGKQYKQVYKLEYNNNNYELKIIMKITQKFYDDFIYNKNNIKLDIECENITDLQLLFPSTIYRIDYNNEHHKYNTIHLKINHRTIIQSYYKNIDVILKCGIISIKEQSLQQIRNNKLSNIC